MISTTNLNQSQNIKQKENSLPKGFTIIEVVLVLAIAGLIFLMVFIALTALQRNQRDTQRKNDMGRVKAAVESFKANNMGRMPTPHEFGHDSELFSETSFGRNYLKADTEGFNDPDGTSYKARYGDFRRVGFNPIEGGNYPRGVWFSVTKTCGPNGFLAEGKGPNSYAIQYILEGGGVYCIDG